MGSEGRGLLIYWESVRPSVHQPAHIYVRIKTHIHFDTHTQNVHVAHCFQLAPASNTPSHQAADGSHILEEAVGCRDAIRPKTAGGSLHILLCLNHCPTGDPGPKLSSADVWVLSFRVTAVNAIPTPLIPAQACVIWSNVTVWMLRKQTSSSGLHVFFISVYLRVWVSEPPHFCTAGSTAAPSFFCRRWQCPVANSSLHFSLPLENKRFLFSEYSQRQTSLERTFIIQLDQSFNK